MTRAPGWMIPVDEVLNTAADHLEHNGWTRGIGVHLDRTCLVGAIAWARYQHHRYPYDADPAVVTMVRYLGFIVRDNNISTLTFWNDAQDDGQPVIAALRAAAVIEAAKRQQPEAVGEAVTPEAVCV